MSAGQPVAVVAWVTSYCKSVFVAALYVSLGFDFPGFVGRVKVHEEENTKKYQVKWCG
jgi:hypothetical protein